MDRLTPFVAISLLLPGACTPPPPQQAMECALIRYAPSPEELRSLGYEPQASAHLLCEDGKVYKVRFDDARIGRGDVSSSELPSRQFVRAVLYTAEGSTPSAPSLFQLADGTRFRGLPQGPLAELDAPSQRAVVMRDSTFFETAWSDVEGTFLSNRLAREEH